MKFAEVLKKLRQKFGISKTDLANKIGVSPSYIMNIEQGIGKPPTPERLEQIANILRLGDDEKVALMWSAMIERVSEQERKMILDSAKELKKLNTINEIMDIKKIPLITFNQLGKISPIFNYSLIENLASDWTLSEKGEADDMFDLKIETDDNSPKINIGDVVRIKVVTSAMPDKFVLVRDTVKKVDFIRQIKEYNGKRFLRPANDSYDEIEMSDNHKVLGVLYYKFGKVEQM